MTMFLHRHASWILILLAAATACAPVIVVAGAGYMIAFERVIK